MPDGRRNPKCRPCPAHNESARTRSSVRRRCPHETPLGTATAVSERARRRVGARGVGRHRLSAGSATAANRPIAFATERAGAMFCGSPSRRRRPQRTRRSPRCRRQPRAGERADRRIRARLDGVRYAPIPGRVGRLAALQHCSGRHSVFGLDIRMGLPRLPRRNAGARTRLRTVGVDCRGSPTCYLCDPCRRRRADRASEDGFCRNVTRPSDG